MNSRQNMFVVLVVTLLSLTGCNMTEQQRQSWANIGEAMSNLEPNFGVQQQPPGRIVYDPMGICGRSTHTSTYWQEKAAQKRVQGY